tara:strand:- start:564 stop:833 length:270 start_codon:yes stop_codon:yes gene_type:complete
MSSFNLEDTNNVVMKNLHWMMVIQGLQRNMLHARMAIQKRTEKFAVDGDPRDKHAIDAYKGDIRTHKALLKLIREAMFTEEEIRHVPDV